MTVPELYRDMEYGTAPEGAEEWLQRSKLRFRHLIAMLLQVAAEGRRLKSNYIVWQNWAEITIPEEFLAVFANLVRLHEVVFTSTSVRELLKAG